MKAGKANGAMMKVNKQARRDHRLKHLQQEENKRILKMRQEGKLITIEEQLKFIDSMPYEDLRRLDHILGNRKSAFTRAGIDNERTTERQNAKKELDNQLKELEDE